MGKKLEEISLTFNRERIRFDGSNVAILECRAEVDPEAKTEVQDDLFGAWNPRNEVIVKAECEPRELTQGLSYRFYGTWSTHPKHGRQFQAKTFVHVQPHGRAGTIRYLMQAPCVGQVTAVTLWDKFQGDAVRILREQPEVAAAAVDRFGQGAAAEASVWLRGQATMEGVTIDLIDLLGGRGFPKNTAKKAVEEWGNRAAEFIGRNPYILGQFRGCGFLRCDQLYHDLGGDPGRLKRQALCASYVLARDRAGHTWHRPQLVERGLRGMISGATVRPLDACRLAKRAKMISVRRDAAGLTWITDRRKANNEADAAERVLEWFREPASWPTIADIDASDHKRQVAVEALQAAVAILTGGPGTGKTYLAVRIIKRIIAVFGADVVAVAAPTGKAAVRITEAMQGYGINLRARTIHSLLGVESRGKGDGWGFKYGPDLPLEYRFIIVDEASMMDTDLAASLFRACAKGTHILLVGDVGQLPPVGHGAPLRDLIAAGVPTGELTEVTRNSGRIVGACHEIRAGKQFVVSPQLDIAAGENLRLLPAVSSVAALEQIVKMIRSIGARGLANPIWDCQVIVAVNKKSELARKAVNQRLQRELNPGGKTAGDNPFREGDKIVCLKNGWYPIVEDTPAGFNEEVDPDGKKVFVANGEQAAVKHVAEKLTIVQMDSPARLVKIPRGGGGDDGDDSDGDDERADTGCQWDLAYGITCHKAQGSEWPVMFIALDEYPGARMVFSREWLYTGLSRAKQACFLVGKLSTAVGMIGRETISKRKTFLVELIEEGAGQ